jgi:hypothetical protein
MAHLHWATLTPSKLELINAWLPTRPWSGGGVVAKLGAYRFDDPAGEVGMEGFLLGRDDGQVLHVPLTYRAAPLAGAEQYLVGTMEHSVLGPRWVYDACGDPVWAAALATAVLTGGTQAEELLEVDGELQPRAPSATVVGSGSLTDLELGGGDSVRAHDDGPTTVIRDDALELVVVRVLGHDVPLDETLTGRWAGGGPAVLAGVRGSEPDR